MKADIRFREDINDLVRAFYMAAEKDELLKAYFGVMEQEQKARFIKHLTDFWENLILFTGDYNGNPMEMHTQLHRRQPLSIMHFQRWNQLFQEVVDQMFEGKNAETIKQKAYSISAVIQMKIFK